MVLQYIYSFLFECEDLKEKVKFGHPYVPFCIVAFYVLFCKWIGPSLMRHRKPFELKNVLIFYNFFQMVANTYLSYQSFCGLVLFWDRRCVDHSDPAFLAWIEDMRLGNWHLYLVKYVDLLDAVFFVLRKKEKQITFLHVFHHVMICILYYLYVSHFDAGLYLVLSLCINCFIHVIMYLYYFLAAFGPHMQKYLWWKKYLTTMQMIQFVIVLLYMVINISTGCIKPGAIEIIFFCFVAALLALFANFYRKSFKTE